MCCVGGCGRGSPRCWAGLGCHRRGGQCAYSPFSRRDPENYRPIAITSVLYRLYGSMVNLVTSQWAEQHHLVPPEQFGFQRRRSTVQAAFVLRHATHARRAAGSRSKLHCAFVDFAKAYDSVSHEKLWRHLGERLQMPVGLLTAIQKLYEGAVYELRDGHKRTGRVPCSRGIKQGCPLSPLLVSLYIGDLPGVLRARCPEEGIAWGRGRLHCIVYADDLTLLADSKEGLQRMLDVLHEYAAGKDLTVNVGKTEVMVYGEQLRRQRTARTPYTYGPTKQPLRRVDEVKFLGLQLRENGRMGPAMEARAAAFAAALHAASRTASRVRLGRHLPTCIRLAEVYVAPAANYGDVVWGTGQLQPAACMSNKIQRAMLGYVKHAAGVPPSTPSWPLVQELGLHPMQRGWWKHTLRFYNQAISASGERLSPLMHAALAEDMQLTQQVGAAPQSWSGQLLAALRQLEEGAAPPGREVAPSALQEAAVALQPLPVAEVLALVDAAYQQGSDSSGRSGCMSSAKAACMRGLSRSPDALMAWL